MNIGVNIKDKLELFNDALIKLNRGQGTIICINGDTGYGKSFLLETFNKFVKEKRGLYQSVIVENQSPIGNFDVSLIQPMLPFSRALQRLYSGEEATPEKKLAKSIFMTTLASMPIVGDVFYFVKETARDWRQYKKEKTSEKVIQVSSAVQDYYDTLISLSDKKPLVLLFDDFHWSDAQSVELLSYIAQNIDNTALLIVFTYRENLLQSRAYPLLKFVDTYIGKYPSIWKIQLEPFTRQEIREICKVYIPKYEINQTFEDWLFDKSMGVPSVVTEYLKYFSVNNPFNPDGTLKNELLSQVGLFDSSVSSIFSQLLDRLSEEEKNILSICSAEGKEFTALVVSKLLNTDVLTTIKRLRSIQNRTGIIKSLGAQMRYGIKTTTYTFTQAFYHTFFSKTLEYEEYIALHSQIANILLEQYNNAESDAVREEIAPYIAAHSAESGDDESARKMMLLTAQVASKYGSSEIVKEVYNDYLSMKQSKPSEGENYDEIDSDELAFKSLVTMANGTNEQLSDNSEHSDETKLNYVDFNTLRKAIIHDFNIGEFQSVYNLATIYINNKKLQFDNSELLQLYCFAIRSAIELNDLESAENLNKEAVEIYEQNTDEISTCLFLNTAALLHYHKGRNKEALQSLEEAAKLLINLPSEMKLLTIANLGLILKESSPNLAEKYIKAARKLSTAIEFDELSRLLN